MNVVGEIHTDISMTKEPKLLVSMSQEEALSLGLARAVNPAAKQVIAHRNDAYVYLVGLEAWFDVQPLRGFMPGRTDACAGCLSEGISTCSRIGAVPCQRCAERGEVCVG